MSDQDPDVDAELCGRVSPHSDHYWRRDGRKVEALDDPGIRWCSGSPATLLGVPDQ
jgi:hypothetical protein